MHNDMGSSLAICRDLDLRYLFNIVKTLSGGLLCELAAFNFHQDTIIGFIYHLSTPLRRCFFSLLSYSATRLREYIQCCMRRTAILKNNSTAEKRREEEAFALESIAHYCFVETNLNCALNVFLTWKRAWLCCNLSCRRLRCLNLSWARWLCGGSFWEVVELKQRTQAKNNETPPTADKQVY